MTAGVSPLTEQLTSSILQSNGYKELSGARYHGGSDKGFDHVVKDADGTVIIFDSKQIAPSGATRLSNSKVTGIQLSDTAIRNVLRNLPAKSEARIAVQNALDNGNLKTAVIGVDKKTGNVTFSPFVTPTK